MKQKILLILTSIVVLLFTGCDAILNAAYPTYDPENGDNFGDNKIYVDLEVNTAVAYGGYPVMLMIAPVYDSGSDVYIDTGSAYTTEFSNKQNIYTYFTNLENNTYIVLAFQDTNYNGKPDSTENGLVLYDADNESNIFNLKSYTSSTTLTATGTFYAINSIDNNITSQFVDPTNDLTFYYSAPSYLSYTGDAYSSDSYYFYPNDASLEIDYIEWKITDHEGLTCEYDGSSDHTTINKDYIYIDYSLLSKKLNDVWWYGYDMYVNVIVHYIGGSSKAGQVFVNLY